jgi:hypothetical protein
MLEEGVLLYKYVFFFLWLFSKEIYGLTNMKCEKSGNQGIIG